MAFAGCSMWGGKQDVFPEAMAEAGKSVSDYLGNGERIVKNKPATVRRFGFIFLRPTIPLRGTAVGQKQVQESPAASGQTIPTFFQYQHLSSYEQ